MANLQDQWQALLGELRREAHKAGIPTESFQQMARYGFAWVMVHEYGSRALALWSSQKNDETPSHMNPGISLRVIAGMRRRAIEDLADCITPVFTDDQLNCLAALHPFGFEARVFGVTGSSYLEAMRRLVDITTEEFWSETPSPGGEVETVTPELSEVAIERCMERHGDIMERWPNWRNELIIEYDSDLNPTFISEWDIEVRPGESVGKSAAIGSDTIVHLNDRNYRFPSGEELPVPPGEHEILKAFLGYPVMDTKTLRERSGAPLADATLRAMSKKPIYKGLIHRPGPGGKSTTGYRISVVSVSENVGETTE